RPGPRRPLPGSAALTGHALTTHRPVAANPNIYLTSLAFRNRLEAGGPLVSPRGRIMQRGNQVSHLLKPVIDASPAVVCARCIVRSRTLCFALRKGSGWGRKGRV